MPFYNRINGNVSIIKKKNKKSLRFYTYSKYQPLGLSARVSYFLYSKYIAQIYRFPTPITTPIVFGVISLGGGLYGTLTGNILTNGDVQNYWTSQGITNQATVVIQLVGGSNNISDLNSTVENTIDVETIGSCCPGSNVTIIIYMAPNSFQGFYNAFNYALNTPVIVNSVPVKPSVISCSWGTAERNYSTTQLNQYNTLFGTAVAKGVNICCASGDNGSSDGLRGLNVDFPGSSPNVISCGGTTLTCPTLTYSGTGTTETGWSGSGGGISSIFPSPVYQTNLQLTKRAVPDVALDANPNTGVIYLINNTQYLVGGTSIVSPAISALIGALGFNTFFNTRLYSLKSTSFYDIVSGSNGAYSSKIGYDYVTGLGSLNGLEIQTELNSWVPVVSVSLNYTTYTLTNRTTLQLIATVLPANATNTSVVWKSSNTNATVTQSGLVTAARVGNVTITATTKSGWLSARCSITIR